MLLAGIAVAGAVGALARYLVDEFVIRRAIRGLPVATLAINISGSFVLGVLTGLVLYHALPATPKIILGTGFCGAFTTFSTMAVDVVTLMKDGHAALGVGYLLVSVALGLVTCRLGVAAGRLAARSAVRGPA